MFEVHADVGLFERAHGDTSRIGTFLERLTLAASAVLASFGNVKLGFTTANHKGHNVVLNCIYRHGTVSLFCDLRYMSLCWCI